MHSPQTHDPMFSLAALAERSRTPARTIRYYIAQGLLPGPRRRGRDAAYGPEHLEGLAEIRRLKQGGCTLAEIRNRLADKHDAAPAGLPAAETWYTYRIAEDVLIQVRAGAAPWRLHHIHELIQEGIARLGDISKGGPDHEQ